MRGKQAALLSTAATPVAELSPQPEPELLRVAAPSAPKMRTHTRTNARIQQTYNQLGRSLALVLSCTIAIGLWLAGAYFTLTFLQGVGFTVMGAGIVVWLIPLAITAVELWLWPKTDTHWQEILMFLTILAVDLGTSWRGFVEWGAGREIPLFTGFVIPIAGWYLHGIALVIGMILAFAPEKIGRWALSELWRLWR